MRVCLVSPYTPKGDTGIGNFVGFLAEHLEHRGHNCFLITVEENGPQISSLSEPNTIGIDCTKWKRLKNLYLGLTSALRLWRIRRKIDVLHCQQAHLQSALALLVAKLSAIPVVVTIHLRISRFRNFLERLGSYISEVLLRAFADQITYVSMHTKSSFARRGRVIFNGVDTRLYVPRDAGAERKKLGLDGSFVILFVGRVTRTKGVFDLLHALSDLKSRTKADIRLVTIGSIPEEEQDDLDTLTKELNLGKNVLHLGVQTSIWRCYGVADVLALPSHYEGMPLSLLEAMSCGLASVASDVGGIPELIIDGANGLLVPARNPPALSERIEWCLRHDTERARIGTRARERVVEEFSLDLMIDKYEKEYSRLVS